MSDAFESLLLETAIKNEQYLRKILPHIELQYFEDEPNRIIYATLKDYFVKFNSIPSKQTLVIEISKHPRLNLESVAETVSFSLKTIFDNSKIESEPNFDWLVQETEKWCQDRAIVISIMESIEIIEGKHKTLSKGAIPELVSKALGVNFDTYLGHDFIANDEERYDYFHTQHAKIPFVNNKFFNLITGNGLRRKTLTIPIAGPGVGKSTLLADWSANFFLGGNNVLYISLEMSEEEIASRIDQNLLRMDTPELLRLDKDVYRSKIEKIGSRTSGKIIIKEYPPSTVDSSVFKALLYELKIKKNFIPDIVMIDYINLAKSSTHRYTNAKDWLQAEKISEEFRAIGVEYNVAVVSPTQFNREGIDSLDPELSDTGKSMGPTFVSDLMFAMISTKEFEEEGKILIKQLKNRYSPLHRYNKFFMGINRSHMRLFDYEVAEANVMNTDSSSLPRPEKTNRLNFE